MPNTFEWEYAARGGTTTTWWTGNDPRSLALAENLCDQTAFADRPDLYRHAEPWTDGHVISAPASVSLPNPFGLHHIHGNVSEWITQQMELTYPIAVRPVVADNWDQLSHYRGGAYSKDADNASSAKRKNSVGGASGIVGIRPVKKIER